jgi:glycosyltransferase involved in cell wall biosynthesis
MPALSPNEPGVLHIAFYCNLMGWPKRSSGGVRQWVLTMANALVERGYRVEVLSEAPPQQFIDEPLLDARVGRVVLGKGRAAWRALRAHVAAHPGLRLVAALDYYNLRAAKLKHEFGAAVQVMVTQRENLSADAAWRSPFKYWWITRGVRKRFNDADAVVTVSHGLADDLHQNFGVRRERLHAIYNPAFRPGFVAGIEAPVDHPFFAPQAPPVFVAAGRLHFVKGFDDLLRAFAMLRRRQAARLVILGEGKERARLEQQVQALGLSADVSLPGRVSSLAPWIHRAAAFVLSSRREGLPAVLIEALAVGASVVSTRCPSGPEEILERGRWGQLVDVGDVAALAQAMERVLTGPVPDRPALRERAAEFSLDRALAAYLALWQRPPVAV